MKIDEKLDLAVKQSEEQKRRIDDLVKENKRRGDYIIHLLSKQNVVMGLNDQDIEWLRELGVQVGDKTTEGNETS